MARIKEIIQYKMILSTMDILINIKITNAILLEAVVWTDIFTEPCAVY